MSLKTTLAILAGRCVKLAAKILRRGGTAKPGEIALKLCPDLPARLAKDMRLAMECVEHLGAKAPLTQVTKQMLDALNEQGYGEQDPTWLLLQMEKEAGMDPKEFK